MHLSQLFIALCPVQDAPVRSLSGHKAPAPPIGQHLLGAGMVRASASKLACRCLSRWVGGMIHRSSMFFGAGPAGAISSGRELLTNPQELRHLLRGWCAPHHRFLPGELLCELQPAVEVIRFSVLLENNEVHVQERVHINAPPSYSFVS